MPNKLVDVFDPSGAKLFSYSIALEDEGCVDAEFEEVALILAESSGRIVAEDIAHLTARCGTVPILELVAEEAQGTARPKRPKNTVVSLVKHRMKQAGMAPARHKLRRTF
ncbi:MAG: hypothetical protein JO056_05260 [Alphaproteobacteria bacterium]|nr:hypothetical protein [Alphaproteobacteria bacterium]